MGEFDRPRGRREQERVRNVQLTLQGLGAVTVQRYEQPEDGVGYTDTPDNVVVLAVHRDKLFERLNQPDDAA